MKRTGRTSKSGFTLVELLVVIGILALLVAVSSPLYHVGIQHANCCACSMNMHSLGIAFLSYSYDHDETLPGRTATGGGDKWPTLLLPYVGNDPRTYIDPGDPVAAHVPLANLISNSSNNSSFLFNGFNDLGAYSNPNITVSLANVPSSGNLILLGQQVAGSDQFYMDFVEGNQANILNKTAYFNGANYVFADGSSKFLPVAQYNDNMWLVNQSYNIPAPPASN